MHNVFEDKITYAAILLQFGFKNAFQMVFVGWNVNDKVSIEIDGKPVTVQIGMNLTIVGSKELPQDGGGGPGPSEEVA